MPKLWICLFTAVAAAGFLTAASADRASALSIGPIPAVSGDSGVVTVACKTGTPHCLPATGLQKKLQDKLKAGGGEVGGTDINCKNTTHCGGCAADWTNCGSSAAMHGGGRVVSRGPRPVTNAFAHASNGPSRGMHR